MKCPCTKDCPDRKTHCNATCEKPEYKAWQEYVASVREKKRKHYLVDDYVVSTTLRNERKRKKCKK